MNSNIFNSSTTVALHSTAQIAQLGVGLKKNSYSTENVHCRAAFTKTNSSLFIAFILATQLNCGKIGSACWGGELGKINRLKPLISLLRLSQIGNQFRKLFLLQILSFSRKLLVFAFKVAVKLVC